ncbi:hypothetical protein [Pectobacterium atrosepticum]|nr:hypothetical protein [Pectobacterium atrosepticum]MDK9443449.1 hypothetical protein [Pectobacterium atrosepticum]
MAKNQCSTDSLLCGVILRVLAISIGVRCSDIAVVGLRAKDEEEV